MPDELEQCQIFYIYGTIIHPKSMISMKLQYMENISVKGTTSTIASMYKHGTILFHKITTTIIAADTITYSRHVQLIIAVIIPL